MTGSRPRLVVLRALGLGDALTAVPALRALATAFPDHHRMLLGPGWVAPLLERTGFVHRIVDHRAIDADALHPLPAVGPVDVAVNLHGRGPQSHRALAALVPRRLIAFADPRRSPADDGCDAGPPWRPGEWEPRRWIRMLAAFGITGDAGALDLPAPELRSSREASLAGVTVIHPGASSAARRWPVERWAAVARDERRHGRRIVVTGSADERELAQAIAARAGARRATGSDDVVDLAGATDIRALAAIVAGAGRVLCGDTGIAHLAHAYRVPSVVLYGPTAPAEWGPPPGRPWHRAIHHPGPAGDPHGARTDPALVRITVDEVLAELELLDRLGAPTPIAPADQGSSGSGRGPSISSRDRRASSTAAARSS